VRTPRSPLRRRPRQDAAIPSRRPLLQNAGSFAVIEGRKLGALRHVAKRQVTSPHPGSHPAPARLPSRSPSTKHTILFLAANLSGLTVSRSTRKREPSALRWSGAAIAISSTCDGRAFDRAGEPGHAATRDLGVKPHTPRDDRVRTQRLRSVGRGAAHVAGSPTNTRGRSRVSGMWQVTGT
jgi:hypothetical protein